MQVTIYTKFWCVYSREAKALLERKGVDFTEIDIEKEPGRRAEMLERSGGRRTVPQVFIGLTHVGGCDELYALENVCPHAYALLTQGFIDGDTVECPLHEAVFHIPTGKCLKEPGGRDLKTYTVRLAGEEIQIKVE